MDFDDVLQKVGSFGLYQRVVICSVLLPAALPCAFHAYSQLFIAGTPKHWCTIPELEPWAHDFPTLVKNLSIPRKHQNGNGGGDGGGGGGYAECLMYDKNYSDIVRYLEYRTPLELHQEQFWHSNSTNEIKVKPCLNGWNYETDMYSSTVVTQWNLVCDRSFYVTLALVTFGIGGLLGNFLFGYLQDRWGRKPSFYLYLLIEIVACAVSAFTTNYWSWLAFRFIVGITVPAILASPYVLAIELVGPDKRVFCTIVSNIAYSCGLVFLAGVVYLIRDWQYLTLAVSLPLLLLFSCFCILPESPRWLYAVGRFQEAEAILKKIAYINGYSQSKLLEGFALPNHSTESTTSKPASETYGIKDLFKGKNMRRKTCIITLIWFANTSVYVGLSYYAPSLGGDEIWNFFLAGAVELPTYILLWPGLNLLGRRWILCLSMLCGGLACLATFLFTDDQQIMLFLYCIGKMGISSAFVVLPLVASEVYPTVVRGLGMSFSSVIAMLGPIFIPIINHLGDQMLVLPLIVMGTLLVIGGLMSLLLPETKNQNLPQTFAEGEAIPLSILGKCL